MNKKLLMVLVSLFFLCVSDSTTQHEFTKPKKVPSLSASQLKEKCCQEMTEHLYHVADIMTSLGNTQRHLLSHGQNLLENNKSSGIVAQNAQQLDQCLQKL